ncbi:RCC1 domain-containing protein 1-like isoform X2 [Scomber scombrus]|uniref:RCC1 domain-containing protein 1-like isoform X2 n=1 Tax=Scomber scombrus TaxID=13677 RepID=UPI002DD88A36|nr:RCC1 domain-containing protein 1-like isoform X2 [Scomber scombrus]
MRWFGFGFNAFGQICIHEKIIKGTDAVKEIKVINPTELGHVDRSGSRQGICMQTSAVRASWSRRASLHLDGCVCLAGFGAVTSKECISMAESRGCKDAFISESYLTLSFPGRVESWDLENKKETPAWSMEIKTQPESSDMPLNLPLVPGGYIATKPPFYQSLSPHLKAKSLALGAEHAVLLSATGAVYTWGLGSHGQLGHGGLTSEEQPRAVEALWGMAMSCVATGGWHSVCISDGGDLYVWGWNESGQLGLPSQALRKAQQQSGQQADVSTSPRENPQEGEDDKEVFISIQAFPALLDITPSCEIKTVSCGSRHTAVVTSKMSLLAMDAHFFGELMSVIFIISYFLILATGDLYTWGWGEYGQLGHQTLSSDEPQQVEFFREQQMCVVNVVCGAWNTFAAVVKEEVANA